MTNDDRPNIHAFVRHCYADIGGWHPESLPDYARADGDIRILHVDDQPDFLELTGLMLEREGDSSSITSAASPADGHARLDETEFDCIVSDYDTPATSGLEFLREVCDAHPGLPFVLFTGKGSEEIASEAIAAGVTDYVQKAGREQYEVLANRIRNAVTQQRATHALEASQEHLARFIEQSPLGIIEWDDERRLVRMNQAAEDILGYAEADLQGGDVARDRSRARTRMGRQSLGGAPTGGRIHPQHHEIVTKNGDSIVCKWYNRAVTGSDSESVGVFSQFQDVTDREEYRRRPETLIENLPGIVYRCRNEPEWPYEFLAGDCEELTGYDTDALVDGDVEWGFDIIVPSHRTPSGMPSRTRSIAESASNSRTTS